MPRPLPPVREFWLADDDPPPGPAPGPCPSLRPSPALRSWVWVGFVQSVSGVKGCPEGMCPARWVWSWTDAVRMPRRTGTRARSVTNQSSPFSKGGFATWEKGRRTKSRPNCGRVRYVPLILFAPERPTWSGLPPPDVRPAPAGAFFSTVVHPSSTIDEVVADRSIPPLLCVQNSSACQHLSALVTSRYARNCRVRRCAKERVSGHVTRCGGPAIRSRAHSSD